MVHVKPSNIFIFKHPEYYTIILIYLTRTCKAICHQSPKDITQDQSAYSFELVINIKLHQARKKVNKNKSRI